VAEPFRDRAAVLAASGRLEECAGLWRSSEAAPQRNMIGRLRRRLASLRCDTQENRNDAHARHWRAQDSLCLCASVPRVDVPVIAKSGDFQVKFDDGGGLKNRCRELKKNAIGQVFACRILTVCGEVAEGGGLLRLPGITERA
jgi:hypothetical protein